MKNNVEILAPAGSKESLMAAIKAGADAVYIGGTKFGARAYANNLEKEDMLWAIDYVHLHGKKIYMTINTLIKDKELLSLYEYLLPYYERGLDAVIVQNVGVMQYMREQFPKMAVHVSTQSTVTGVLGAKFYEKLGVTRVVPAREISLREIKKIKNETNLEIECFVHGALCYCYSGQCLFSSLIGGRSGNRGQCAQPCRLPFSTNGKKAYDLLSLKDLCTIEKIPDLIEAGIDSFKIEGRMKQPQYVYTVVKMYRKYVDHYYLKGRENFSVSKEDIRTLQNVYQRRGYTDGYYTRHNGKEMISLNQPVYKEADSVEINDFDVKMQEKINGKLILKQNENAKLYVEYHGLEVNVEGDMVQAAMKQPLSIERIEKQMRKTGESDFEFESLDVSAEDNIFLPMKSINELRRTAMESLKESILARYIREFPKQIDENVCVNSCDQEKKKEYNQHPVFSVLVSSMDQLIHVIKMDMAEVLYVDCIHTMNDFESIKALLKSSEIIKKAVLVMPYIFREHAINYFESIFEKVNEIFDGVMIRNYEEYQWLLEKEYAKEIQSDSGVYIWNQWDKKMVENLRIQTWTAPVELNQKELMDLNITSGVLSVYGYVPLMITANCLQKTTEKCNGKERILYMKDRKQVSFPVYNCCKYCYNIIYNSKPLMLHNEIEQIQKLAPKEVRIDFRFESKEEIEKILGLYWDVFMNYNDQIDVEYDFTKGHFRRGVK